MFAATRRHFLLPMAAAALLVSAAVAAPAAVKTQAPGFYRMAVGSFEVTALYDGNLRIGTQLLHGIGPEAVPGLLQKEFADANDKGVLTAINAFLVNTGEHLILVDAGLGSCNGPATGHMSENLKAAGYRPEDVDAVLITHMHGDHVCGLSKDGARLFPKATVYAADTEIAYWLTTQPIDPAAERKKGVQGMLQAYSAAGAIKGFKPGATLFPGVVTVDTHGHTPGHTSYLFQSGGQNFLAIGDVAHVHAVQFAHPEVTIDYDSDQPTAKAARAALFERVAKDGWAIGGVHLPFPGIGHLRKEGTGYSYVRVEYAPLP
jgi:glyoxylase-like metal-dependent hydrolase (beta-lactamase superfamily II)